MSPVQDNSQPPPLPPLLRQPLVAWGIFAVAYSLAVMLGYAMHVIPPHVATFWPATGVTVAALILSERRRWLVYLLTAAAVQAVIDPLMMGGPFDWPVLLFGVNNAIAALVAVYLVRVLLNFDSTISGLRETLLFTSVAAVASAATAAVLGTLINVSLKPDNPILGTMHLWFFGDVLGIVLTTTAILTGVRMLVEGERLVPSRRIELGLLLVSTAVIAGLVFAIPPDQSLRFYAYPYLVFPGLVWAALRFNPGVVSLTAIIVTLVAAWNTAQSRGPFAGRADEVLDAILALQAFLAVSVFVALILSAVITDRRRVEQRNARLQAQLHQAQKLDAVGQLAGGVAHDFNNLLSVISAHAELLGETLAQDPRVRDSLSAMQEAVQQATGVTRSLLTFSHKVKPQTRSEDLRQIVRTSLRMLRRSLPAMITVDDQGIAGQPLWVNADRTQIQQVVLNLTLNARDAMPQGGTLTLRVEPVTDAQGGPAEHARLLVADTGTGIAESLLPHLFEPFFTTKPRGQGTGLGLAVVRSIVTEHQGTISVTSTPDQGTTFTVELPTIVPPAEVLAAAAAEATVHRKLDDTVLLAEDQPQIRAIVTSALMSMGCQVVQAQDGEQLMQQFDKHADCIRLLLLDVDLPKRTGLDCLRELRSRGLRLPAIIMTGSLPSPDARTLDERSVLLLKPFQIAQLRTMVRDALITDEADAHA